MSALWFVGLELLLVALLWVTVGVEVRVRGVQSVLLSVLGVSPAFFEVLCLMVSFFPFDVFIVSALSASFRSVQLVVEKLDASWGARVVIEVLKNVKT